MSILDYKAIFFDFDGVIADTDPALSSAWKATLAYYGLYLQKELIQSHITGQTYQNSLRWVETSYSWDAPPGFKDTLDCFYSTYSHEISPVLDAEKTLQLIRSRSIPFGIVSNSERERLKFKLDILGFGEFVAKNAYDPSMVGGRAKPFPDLYLFVAACLKVEPEQCLVVEDSVVGIRAASAANMEVWGFTLPDRSNPLRDMELSDTNLRRVIASHKELQDALLL